MPDLASMALPIVTAACVLLAWGLRREGLSWVRSASWSVAAWAAMALVWFTPGEGELRGAEEPGVLGLAVAAFGAFLGLAAFDRRFRPAIRPASGVFLILAGLQGVLMSLHTLYGASTLYRLPTAVCVLLLGSVVFALGRRLKVWAALALVPPGLALMAVPSTWEGENTLLQGGPWVGSIPFVLLMLTIVGSGLFAGLLRPAVAPSDRSPWRWCRTCRKACGPGRCADCGGRPRWSARERLEAWSAGIWILPGLLIGIPFAVDVADSMLYQSFPGAVASLFQSAALLIGASALIWLSLRLATGIHRDRVAEIEAEYGEPPLAPHPIQEPVDPIAIAREAPAPASLPVNEIRQSAGTAS